jgi:hypothetical protein
MSKSN